jgi:hypothetical protein
MMSAPAFEEGRLADVVQGSLQEAEAEAKEEQEGMVDEVGGSAEEI